MNVQESRLSNEENSKQVSILLMGILGKLETFAQEIPNAEIPSAFNQFIRAVNELKGTALTFHTFLEQPEVSAIISQVTDGLKLSKVDADFQILRQTISKDLNQVNSTGEQLDRESEALYLSWTAIVTKISALTTWLENEAETLKELLKLLAPPDPDGINSSGIASNEEEGTFIDAASSDSKVDKAPKKEEIMIEVDILQDAEKQLVQLLKEENRDVPPAELVELGAKKTGINRSDLEIALSNLLNLHFVAFSKTWQIHLCI